MNRFGVAKTVVQASDKPGGGGLTAAPSVVGAEVRIDAEDEHAAAVSPSVHVTTLRCLSFSGSELRIG